MRRDVKFGTPGTELLKTMGTLDAKFARKMKENNRRTDGTDNKGQRKKEAKSGSIKPPPFSRGEE